MRFYKLSWERKEGLGYGPTLICGLGWGGPLLGGLEGTRLGKGDEEVRGAWVGPELGATCPMHFLRSSDNQVTR